MNHSKYLKNVESILFCGIYNVLASLVHHQVVALCSDHLFISNISICFDGWFCEKFGLVAGRNLRSAVHTLHMQQSCLVWSRKQTKQISHRRGALDS